MNPSLKLTGEFRERVKEHLGYDELEIIGKTPFAGPYGVFLRGSRTPVFVESFPFRDIYSFYYGLRENYTIGFLTKNRKVVLSMKGETLFYSGAASWVDEADRELLNIINHVNKRNHVHQDQSKLMFLLENWL